MSDELERAGAEYLGAVGQKFQEDFPDVVGDQLALADATIHVQQSLNMGAANDYDLYRRAGETARSQHSERLERIHEAKRTREILNEMRVSRGQEPL